ncbi:exodeoxyribonuclease VII small subunit [Candidatus Azambacteria bacterium]|nr:exodeoxyribonuclease VII small subunit [Candidatus Azambacteria bacterium]
MKKNFNFAKSYKELESIADEFESGNLSLEDGLKKFERGLLVADECKEYIESIENKIIEIKKKHRSKII